ncbi:MAG: hypothetical protein HY692_07635 [Cyanobacteria bacterium NC_groundwater_1444_Ag_S-0.65um_54_12]|nr:hypothetical protein [Cyanobacteria bacterium NC_groundwater_1444_Ag_S-0.65um_54_12]
MRSPHDRLGGHRSAHRLDTSPGRQQ